MGRLAAVPQGVESACGFRRNQGGEARSGLDAGVRAGYPFPISLRQRIKITPVGSPSSRTVFPAKGEPGWTSRSAAIGSEAGRWSAEWRKSRASKRS